MRRALLAVLALAGCRTVTNEPARPVAEAKPAAPPPALAPAVDAGAPATAAPIADGPLAWGTRPTGDGPLYPVVDGMCIHGEVWQAGATSLYSFGSDNGPWTRSAGSTALARFSDEGLVLDRALTTPADPSQADPWLHIGSIKLLGSLPGTLFLYSHDNGNGRTRDFETFWQHGENGWSRLASWRDAGNPDFVEPVAFGGHLITVSRMNRDDTREDSKPDTLKTWPLEKDAPPVPGLASLLSASFHADTFIANGTTLHAFGTLYTKDSSRYVLRSLSGGKVSEAPVPSDYAGARHIGATPSALYFLSNERLILRFENGKYAPVSIKQPVTVALKSVTVLPSGDIWALTSTNKIVVAHGDAVTETPLPKPANPKPEEQVFHWPKTGKRLAGVEVDDPWAIGERGSLFHLVDGTWKEVELPAPPFATNGKYQAQALSVPAKGDVFVNAGYAEKGLGWKTEERYRAILRTKRPREVVRCNEPNDEKEVPLRFTSFAPIASETCTTPFVVLLRIGAGMSTKSPSYAFDAKTDYPAVREAIKSAGGAAGLGATVDLVELVAGDQRFLGAKVPTVAAGKALALTVAKKVQLRTEVRPEVVCGAPKEERVLHVDVATGNVQ